MHAGRSTLSWPHDMLPWQTLDDLRKLSAYPHASHRRHLGGLKALLRKRVGPSMIDWLRELYLLTVLIFFILTQRLDQQGVSYDQRMPFR